jgi:hypothetical protein
MTENHNLKRRVARIEDRCGLSGNDEMVMLDWPDGRTVQTTRRAMQDFLDSLREDDQHGQAPSATG